MKILFDENQQHQLDAISAVVDLFILCRAGDGTGKTYVYLREASLVRETRRTREELKSAVPSAAGDSAKKHIYEELGVDFGHLISCREILKKTGKLFRAFPF